MATRVRLAYSPDRHSARDCAVDHPDILRVDIAERRADDDIQVFEIATGHKRIGPSASRRGPVHAMAFSADGKTLTSVEDST